MKKEEKKKEYYDIVVEAQVPCQLRYRVLAESPEAALEEMKRVGAMNVKPNLSGKRDRSATVYLSGSSLIQFIKRWM